LRSLTILRLRSFPHTPRLPTRGDSCSGAARRRRCCAGAGPPSSDSSLKKNQRLPFHVRWHGRPGGRFRRRPYLEQTTFNACLSEGAPGTVGAGVFLGSLGGASSSGKTQVFGTWIGGSNPPAPAIPFSAFRRTGVGAQSVASMTSELKVFSGNANEALAE